MNVIKSRRKYCLYMNKDKELNVMHSGPSELGK